MGVYFTNTGISMSLMYHNSIAAILALYVYNAVLGILLSQLLMKYG